MDKFIPSKRIKGQHRLHIAERLAERAQPLSLKAFARGAAQLRANADGSLPDLRVTAEQWLFSKGAKWTKAVAA